ncbi:hypothetical protein CI238_02290, partial [Colletotrichum incanum]
LVWVLPPQELTARRRRRARPRRRPLRRLRDVLDWSRLLCRCILNRCQGRYAVSSARSQRAIKRLQTTVYNIYITRHTTARTPSSSPLEPSARTASPSGLCSPLTPWQSRCHTSRHRQSRARPPPRTRAWSTSPHVGIHQHAPRARL